MGQFLWNIWGGPEKDLVLVSSRLVQALSPRIRLANCTSFGIMVTRFAWIAQRLVSSNNPTRYASAASCSAIIADDWNLKSVLKSWAISLTSRWKGNFLIRSSVDFWYLLISRNATVPGRYLCGFLGSPPCIWWVDCPPCPTPAPDLVLFRIAALCLLSISRSIPWSNLGIGTFSFSLWLYLQDIIFDLPLSPPHGYYCFYQLLCESFLYKNLLKVLWQSWSMFIWRRHGCFLFRYLEGNESTFSHFKLVPHVLSFDWQRVVMVGGPFPESFNISRNMVTCTTLPISAQPYYFILFRQSLYYSMGFYLICFVPFLTFLFPYLCLCFCLLFTSLLFFGSCLGIHNTLSCLPLQSSTTYHQLFSIPFYCS